MSNLRTLFGYRALIQSLVVRDLKARYRGSVLGFLWSFINPLLLLSVYTFVFAVMPATKFGGDPGQAKDHAVLIFSGLLPWSWFSSSLLESSTVLVAGGNLIRKVLFPAEILPLVTVLAGLANFCLGLPILLAFVAYFGSNPIVWTDLLWLPIIVAIQLTLTTGLALLLSVITVHFRDVRDLLANVLTLWFFASPILYQIKDVTNPTVRHLMLLNPFAHLAGAYQGVLYEPGPFTGWPRLLIIGACSLVVLAVGFIFFDRLRDTLAEAA